MVNTKYNTSLKSALNICFSYVWIGRIKHIYSYYEIVFEELQNSFINGLEIAINDSSLTDYKGVNRDNLREMVEIAREDWNNFETIKKLYRRKYAITGESLDEYMFRKRELN